MPRFRVGDEALFGDDEVTIEASEKRESGEHFYAVKKPDGSHHYVSEHKLKRWHYVDRPIEHDAGYYRRKNEGNLARARWQKRRIRSLLT